MKITASELDFKEKHTKNTFSTLDGSLEAVNHTENANLWRQIQNGGHHGTPEMVLLSTSGWNRQNGETVVVYNSIPTSRIAQFLIKWDLYAIISDKTLRTGAKK